MAKAKTNPKRSKAPNLKASNKDEEPAKNDSGDPPNIAG